MKPKIEIPKVWLEKFCQEHYIVKLALFGSVISNHFNDKSDVDILVEFDPKHIPGLFSFVDIKDALLKI